MHNLHNLPTDLLVKQQMFVPPPFSLRKSPTSYLKKHLLVLLYCTIRSLEPKKEVEEKRNRSYECKGIIIQERSHDYILHSKEK